MKIPLTVPEDFKLFAKADAYNDRYEIKIFKDNHGNKITTWFSKLQECSVAKIITNENGNGWGLFLRKKEYICFTKVRREIFDSKFFLIAKYG